MKFIEAKQVIGRSPIESIQSGLFYGALGACKEIIGRIKQEIFPHEQVSVIGTGGFASLFEKHEVYDVNIPDLVLQGLRWVLKYNQ